MNKITTLFLIVFILGCTDENENLKNLRFFINAVNKTDVTAIDSLLTENFKYISDSISNDKNDYLEVAKKQDTTWTIELIDIIESTDVIKTKESMTNYGIRTLEMEPVTREREYHFNDNHKIRSIYTLNFKSLPEHEKFDKYFGIWATIYYPEMVRKIREKRENGEDFFEERHFLLIQLKQKGLFMLDSAKIIYENQLIEKQKERKKQQDYYNSLVPAPLYDYLFEKVLTTMMSLASAENIQLPINNPKEQRKLLENAFKKNGYSYSKTLHKLAEYGFSPSEFQYVQILLMPVMELESESQIANIYSGQELSDVKKIMKIMNNY